MLQSRDALKRFVLKRNKFFKAPINEEVIVRYVRAEIVPNYFNGGKTEIIRYHLEVDGILQLWDRTSKDLAKQMSKITEGSFVSILRTGQGNKTRYKIKRVE